jgi:hypothetical protein
MDTFFDLGDTLLDNALFVNRYAPTAPVGSASKNKSGSGIFDWGLALRCR